MSSLSVSICGVDFKNPLIAASGTYGFGTDYSDLYSPSILGGVSLKGTTLEPRAGNNAPRVCECASGMLNSVGLQNPGIEKFCTEELVKISGESFVKIANIAGFSIEEFVAMTTRLEDTDIQMIEVNISCPNVKHGGAAFGADPDMARRVTAAVKAATTKPVMVKLSPNVTDIAAIALACQEGGADCISLINTLLGMRIDIDKKIPLLANNVGGMSGPCVFPVALRMVWQVANAVDIPVIGLGGISKWQDVVEMMLAGASAVQIGTSMFTDPFTPVKIIEGLTNYLKDNNIESISELTGKVIPFGG